MFSAWILAAAVLAQPAGPGRQLSGIVEDQSGGSLPGASVVVTCGPDVRTTTATATGSFTVRDLPARPCEVTGRLDLFQPATVRMDLTTRANGFVRLVLSIAGLQSEVVVTPARGERERAFDVPEAVAVTTREELESRPFQILPQVLKEETGVLVQQTTTAQGSPFIRGFSAQRIVYLVDGVRLNTSTFRAGATQYLGWIDAGIVDRLEVVRGPSSVQYGSDALGGTINVLSLRPELSSTGRRSSGFVELTGATADLSGGAMGHVTMSGRSIALRLGASGRRVQDLRTGGGLDSHAAVTRFLGLPSDAIDDRLRDSGFGQGGGHAAVTWAVTPTSSLHALYLHEEQTGVSRYDRIWGGDGLFRSEFDPQRLDFGVVRYDRTRAGPLQGFTSAFSFNRQQDDRLEQARAGATIDREFARTLALGYQAQASRTLGATSVVTFGGELYDEFIATAHHLEPPTGPPAVVRPEIPDGTRYRSTGAFAQATTDLHARVTLRGGVRYGRFTFATAEQPQFGVVEETIAADAVTFNAGAVINLLPWLNATLGANRGFRAANALDLGGIGLSGAGFEISPALAASLGARVGSDDGATAVSTGTAVEALRPEALYAFEVALKAQGPRASASITLFDLELHDAIQRRTAIFPRDISGTAISGYEVVRQDAEGRAFTDVDPRPILARVNVERARIRGVEADGSWRITPEWVATANFAVTNGRDLDTGAFMRRMPPPLGAVRLKYEPATSAFWMEGVAAFAGDQTRLAPGDLSDARIGARRTRASIATYFTGTAADLGLVRNGVLVSTGETLTEVQQRVLGGATAATLFDRTPGFVVFSARGGWRFNSSLDLTVIAENLADRNYRWHGSGVDAPGFNVQVKTRYRF